MNKIWKQNKVKWNIVNEKLDKKIRTHQLLRKQK